MNHLLDRRDFLRMGAAGALGWGRPARSCIVIWQSGGVSHLDTFDLKPDAPREIRGEFRPISTNVPGVRICEHLPLTARQADKFTILRSMCSMETNHERAAHYLETGHPLSPGRSYPSLREVLSTAPGRTREAYGNTPLGQQCLRALRAVEAGARWVSVRQSGYDTHAGNFRRLKEILLPEFDRAFATLLEDLGQGGLLETTLVIALSEFGRTPRINRQGGRDHHSSAWSIVLAGAGLPGGRVLGATGRTGEEVTDLPVSPADLVRSIRAILEADPARSEVAGGRVIKELVA